MSIPKHIKEHAVLDQSSALGSVSFQGAWNASTNTPTIISGIGNKGWYYIVSVAGSTSIDGENDWDLKDWIIFNGTIWEKVDNSDQDTWQYSASHNGNATVTQFLSRDNNQDTNLTPFIMPVNCKLITIIGKSDIAGNSGTWNANIYKNSSLVYTTNVTLNKIVQSGLSVSFSLGDELSMEFEKVGAGIPNNVQGPSISAFFKETI